MVPPGERKFQDRLHGRKSLSESLYYIILLGRDCRHDDKFGVDVNGKDRVLKG